MNQDIAVKIEHVSKTFKLPYERHSSLKSSFINFRKRGYELQKALSDVSFDVKRGEFFGIVGLNGSGKSTLLKMIAGIYVPTKGDVIINGSLTPFIELGVGFNKELTGRENVFLNGALLGFNRKQMRAMYDDIVEFAELEKFMDQKLKNYSSGMQVRLAFSIAIRAQSDILLLDEVLAVGDAIFQQKCYNYFHQLKKKNKTVLFVSHDISALSQYCTRGILLEEGQLIKEGPIDDVLNQYIEIISDREAKNIDKKPGDAPLDSRRRGTGKARVDSAGTLSVGGHAKKLFGDEDEKILINVKYTAKSDIESPVYGIVIKDESGAKIFASNNLWLSQKSKDLPQGARQETVWSIPNIFNTGEYFISPAVADTFGRETYDSVDDMASFKVRKKRASTGLTNVSHQLELNAPVVEE